MKVASLPATLSGRANHADHADRTPGPLDVLTISTVVLGLALAMAPVVGTLTVTVVSLLWFLAVAVGSGRLVRHLRSWTLAEWILVVSTGLTAVRLSGSGLTQWASDRPTLFWNVDWRYAATQAQGIARFGSLEDSLDFAGQPVRYHVGPAWIGGSLARVADIPVNVTLLVAVPLASTLVVAICMVRLLRLVGVVQPSAALATALALNLPGNPYLLLRQTYGSFRGQEPLADVLTDAENWWFSQDMMLNSMTGLAVGLAASCLLADPSSRVRVVVGAAGMGSLLAIKPQYAVGLLAVLGWGILHEQWRRGPRRSTILWVGLGFGVTAATALRLNPSAIGFVDVQVSVGPALVTELVTKHSVLVLTCTLGAALLLHMWRHRSIGDRLSHFMGGGLAGAAVLFLAMETSTFLVSADAVAQANRIGLAYTTASQDFNLEQAMRPATLLVAALVTALMLQQVGARPRVTRALSIASVTLMALTVPLTMRPLVDPTGPAAYEVAEEPALARLMASTQPTDGLWVSNDLADPTENFSRPLRATTLTSFAPAQFYLSNAAYMGWTQPEVVERVTSLQRFFLTEWSAWHADFLSKNDIKHVIIRDRCPTAWAAVEAGTVIGADGPWTLVDVGAGNAAPQQKAPGTPVPTTALPQASTPLYGLSACLTGDGPKP